MHAIAWGQRLFGRVDRVPGRYHVATLCFHFCYAPLVPLGTYLVFSQSMSGMDTEFEGVRIPFSLKSWLVAWLRSVLWFLLVVASIGGVTTFFEEPPVSPAEHVTRLAIPSALALLLFGPYAVPGLGRATRGRAAQLEAYAAAAPTAGTARGRHW